MIGNDGSFCVIVWLCVAVGDYVSLCEMMCVVYGFVWLCVIMCDYV